MREDDWNALIYAISRQNCILLLGPEIPTEKVNREEKPLFEVLANFLATKVKDKKKIFDPDNLAHVAQQYSLQESRLHLESAAISFYQDRLEQDSAIHSDLAALPFYIIINSTHDNLMVDAFAKNQKEPIVECYDFNGGAKNLVQMGTVEKPMVYYLYGAIQQPQSLVISENDLLDFLVAVISDNPRLPNNIRSEFKKRGKCFLFLGFGLKHWYLRILLHALQGENKDIRSFALEQFKNPFDHPDSQQIILFYQEGYKVQFEDLNLHLFAKELRKRYEKSAQTIPQLTALKDELSQRPPIVFLCHANENKDFAAKLYKELEQVGLQPWLDKEDIQGGDEWDRLVEKTIHKDIDYFVILQSHALIKKFEGYVHKEIDLALKRQRQFRKGIRFIIPVKIDDASRLGELEHLQTIDLTEGPVNELISVIKLDYQRRIKLRTTDGDN